MYRREYGLTYQQQLQDEAPCNDPHCVITAARLLNSLNTSADPCDDFYEFACGGYIKSHPIPDDKSQVGSFNDLAEDNLRLLRNVLSGPYKADPSLVGDEAKVDRANFDKAQGFYQSCMNETLIETANAKPLINFLRTISQKFPLTSGNSLDRNKLIAALADAHTLGSQPFFSMYVTGDEKDPDLNIIRFTQAGLTLPSKEYYEEVDFVEALEGTVRKAFEVILANVTEEGGDWKILAKDVVGLEVELAGISLSSSEMQDPSKLYNQYTPKSLNALSGAIPWDRYLLTRFPKDKFPNIINDTTLLIVETPTYLAKWTQVLAATKPATVENYLLWTYIWNYSDYVSKDVRDILLSLKQKTGEKAQTEPPRWRTCVQLADGVLGEIPAKWFVEKAFGGDSKQAASQSIAYIKKAFLKALPNIDWIDEETRKMAVEKVENLISKIGYADTILKPAVMAKKYAELSVKPETYFENVVSAEKWSSTDNLKDILKPVDRAKWHMTPPTVNAYYNPPMNEIVFPAGILQPPFYGAKDPQYLNYGAIGMVVGHELTHAFDNNGRQYDSKGRLRDWWTNSTSEEFEKRAQCFVDQYSKYSVVGPNGQRVNVDGKLTLGENLADNGGMSRALEAWKADMAGAGGEERNRKLPGFDGYSKEQLLYLGFAQVWCGNIRPEMALKRVRTDPHSPARYRVNGAVANSKEFAEAYRCKAGSRMNPVDKCLIW
ncbi:Endothelin-converting enzyme 1 [Rhizophlyctis rosea]|nr:Endothelin-converting enzyme 1 [Rhizophlyctis rosea]